jgi:hypothetical protein
MILDHSAQCTGTLTQSEDDYGDGEALRKAEQISSDGPIKNKEL